MKIEVLEVFRSTNELINEGFKAGNNHDFTYHPILLPNAR